MLKKLIFAGGMAYLARKLFGSRRSTSDYPASGSRWGRRW